LPPIPYGPGGAVQILRSPLTSLRSARAALRMTARPLWAMLLSSKHVIPEPREGASRAKDPEGGDFDPKCPYGQTPI